MLKSVEFRYSEEKDAWLLKNRGIGFRKVIECIEAGHVLGVEKHPSEKYPRQYIATIEIGGYAHLVPFIQESDHVFLKTIIPSRKATKKYLGGKNG